MSARGNQKSSGSNNKDKNGGKKKSFGGAKGNPKKKFGGPSRGKDFVPSTRKRKVEIVFDPDARHEYLTGFSKRKRERRAFGLAMQKVKDRRTKLEDRKLTREARMKELEEMEEMKRNLMEEGDGAPDFGVEEGIEKDENLQSGSSQPVRTIFQDESTQNQFGAEVVVTTTFGIPEDSEDEADEAMLQSIKKVKGVDMNQRKAGSVKHFMTGLKGNLPGKKKNEKGNAMRKGMHGARAMKGMGGAENMKMACKVLNTYRSNNKGKEEPTGKRGGKKGKKEKRGGKR